MTKHYLIWGVTVIGIIAALAFAQQTLTSSQKEGGEVAGVTTDAEATPCAEPKTAAELQADKERYEQLERELKDARANLTGSEEEVAREAAAIDEILLTEFSKLMYYQGQALDGSQNGAASCRSV